MSGGCYVCLRRARAGHAGISGPERGSRTRASGAGGAKGPFSDPTPPRTQADFGSVLRLYNGPPTSKQPAAALSSQRGSTPIHNEDHPPRRGPSSPLPLPPRRVAPRARRARASRATLRPALLRHMLRHTPPPRACDRNHEDTQQRTQPPPRAPCSCGTMAPPKLFAPLRTAVPPREPA